MTTIDNQLNPEQLDNQPEPVRERVYRVNLGIDHMEATPQIARGKMARERQRQTEEAMRTQAFPIGEAAVAGPEYVAPEQNPITVPESSPAGVYDIEEIRERARQLAASQLPVNHPDLGDGMAA